jgi:hypothetical protein
MYGALRDLFIDVLGYPAAAVVIDTSGESGRPDITVRAGSGLVNQTGAERLVDWIVVEAKARPGSFAETASRERIFSLKAKYITPHTAWFLMVDPQTLVARPVDGPLNTAADIVIDLDTVSLETVRARLVRLHSNEAGVPRALERFRSGDVTMIGYEKLSSTTPLPNLSEARIRVAQKRFTATLRDAAASLCDAAEAALARQKDDIEELWQHIQNYKKRFPDAVVTADPPTAYARARSREEHVELEAATRRLRAALQRTRSIARLAVDVLPRFAAENGKVSPEMYRRFAVQTAHLLLARVLLLRFFEDHGFFGDKKYLCNGGVAAFQAVFKYFDISYVRLLEQAYTDAARLYAAAFDPHELDWILSTKDPGLSRAIERTMFQLARFDFTSVRGDLLNGIYERFLDPAQRKLLGEFYTPSSIARYMVDVVDIRPGDRVLDPACGSGTFLIAAYEHLVGDDVARGIGDYASASDVLENLAGNDLNGFSAALTQIQLIWHLMPFRDEMVTTGLPPLHVTENINSLKLRRVDEPPTAFEDIDQPIHDAVVGNPPYVRSERSDGGLDSVSERYYLDGPGKTNVAGLFVHRALDYWCKREEDRAGKVAFVLPAGVFDGNETEKLRALFLPGGRFRIRRLVDLEAFHHLVFPEAKVIPVLFFAEPVTASADDEVEIVTPDIGCVDRPPDGTRPTFALDRAPVHRVHISDIFTPDGRILTRLNSRRAELLRKLRGLPKISAIAARLWVCYKGSRVVEWRDTPPPVGAGGRWRERPAVGGGLTFRGVRPQEAPGVDHPRLWKGQNIVTGTVVGEPAVRSFDLAQSDDLGLLRYGSALPQHGWAFCQITLAPCCAPFDRKVEVFDNTATLLFPKSEYESVPFDLLMASRVYSWIYGTGYRMGLLAKSSGRSHLYPTNLLELPVSNDLVAAGATLAGLRVRFEEACRAFTRSFQEMKGKLSEISTVSLRDAVKRTPGAKLEWSDAFDDPETRVNAGAAHIVSAPGDVGAVRLTFGTLLEWVEFSEPELATRAEVALLVEGDDELSRRELLEIRIPSDEAALQLWRDTVNRSQPT